MVPTAHSFASHLEMNCHLASPAEVLALLNTVLLICLNDSSGILLWFLQYSSSGPFLHALRRDVSRDEWMYTSICLTFTILNLKLAFGRGSLWWSEFCSILFTISSILVFILASLGSSEASILSSWCPFTWVGKVVDLISLQYPIIAAMMSKCLKLMDSRPGSVSKASHECRQTVATYNYYALWVWYHLF